jgi:regulation of enolase protein 1 (concanavalin A-like superfamily)
MTGCLEMFKNFKWDNKSEAIIRENSIMIKAMPNTSYFIEPSDEKQRLNAPYFYFDCSSDFIIKAKVTPNFLAVYDACALLAMSSDTCWAKLCFEYTDIGTHAVVSVVTNGVSDDANGVDIDGDSVYLQLAKKGDIFAMHYSVDDNDYKMVRYFRLPSSRTWKIGFVGQSPTGTGCDCLFEEIEFHAEAPNDLRKGI